MDIDAFPRLGRRGAELSGSRAGDGAGPGLRLGHGFESGTGTIGEVALEAFARRHLCELADLLNGSALSMDKNGQNARQT